MMGTTENDEKGQIEREVSLWCRIKNFPYELYQKLSPPNKITFYKLTCQPTSMTSTQQREDLFKSLLSPGNRVAGRGSFYPQELLSADKKEKYFSPITSKEKNEYLSRF